MTKARFYPHASVSAVCGVFLALVLLALLGSPAAAHHVMDNQLPATFLQGLLSGLGHPVIGLDHLAAIIAIGCIAATQPRGAMLAVGFVMAMLSGVTIHLGQATISGAELLVALSVVLLGIAMLRLRPVARGLALLLFALAGFVHGYALGESIVGAEPAPLYAYLAGLAIIQSAITFAAMTLTRWLLARPSFEPVRLRLVGAGIAGFGFALLMSQLGA
ncbi:MAG: HupE/UreJ family protein [Xanthobacteraceae bacterium]